MRREYLPSGALQTWMNLNDIHRKGINIELLSEQKGAGIITTAESLDNEIILITVPSQLVLSPENVWLFAKSDTHLKEVLEAVGEYSRSTRGAILIFLLMQITHSAVAGSDKIGVSNPLTEYVKFLPPEVPLPTFWAEEERALAAGTSLQAALEAKLKSLDREFSHLHDSTKSIAWCQKHWWNTETGGLTFQDWKVVDAMYRSRALELPGTGHAMVPCIDMANHAGGDDTVALYDTDVDDNAILVLRDCKSLKASDEVTITYGDEKGACEMLFSYGFIEDTMTSARELFLDLDIPDDDPLAMAKKAVAKSAPGFRLFLKNGSINWEGDYVWLVCVNEEDGLDFRLLQTTDGEKELKVFWNDDEIENLTKLRRLAREDGLWDVFHLRAIATLQGRIEQQLQELERSQAIISMAECGVNDNTYQRIMRLRELEEQLMLQAYGEFDEQVSASKQSACVLNADITFQKNQLLESRVVQDYLRAATADREQATEDDFS
ncbi:MAG: hypothetical protein Q9181_001711 [Wetmoreana brouardii]